MSTTTAPDALTPAAVPRALADLPAAFFHGQDRLGGLLVPALVILTVRDGRVTHLRGMFDRLGLRPQIGALPG